MQNRLHLKLSNFPSGQPKHRAFVPDGFRSTHTTMSKLQTVPQAGALPNSRRDQQPRLAHWNNDHAFKRAGKTLNAFDNTPQFSRGSLPSIGTLKSMQFSIHPTPPLTPPEQDTVKYSPFIPSSSSKPTPAKMNTIALDDILDRLEPKSFASAARVACVWRDILSTLTQDNSPCKNTLEEESAASQHEVTKYMTFAVCTRAEWLPSHNTVNLILYNHHDAVGSNLCNYATWKPAVERMSSWLRERNHSHDDFLSQSTFGIVTAGSRFIVMGLYPGARRAYGEPDEDGNVKVRDLLDGSDLKMLQRLLPAVGSSEPPRQLSMQSGLDEIVWLPLEVGREEDAAKINSERRNSRSEKQKPALGSMGPKMKRALAPCG